MSGALCRLTLIQVHAISEKVYVGLTGFNADTTTVLNELRTHQKIYEMREQRPIAPKVCDLTITNLEKNPLKVLASYFSWMLYKRRFGPYLIEPIVAGLNKQNVPYIAHMDVVGNLTEPEDYLVAGTGGELAMSLCEGVTFD